MNEALKMSPQGIRIKSVLELLSEMEQKKQYGSIIIFIKAGQITNASKKEDIDFIKDFDRDR